MARLIRLTQGYSAIVDDADYDWLNAFKWCVIIQPHCSPRAARNVYPGGRQTTEYMHRLLLPGVDLVDHRDGDGLNNRRSNLRPATASGNAQNSRRQRNNTSGYIGVTWDRDARRWQARISLNNRVVRLGRFTDPIEAARARDAAALELHGEFASLNFPTIEGDS